MCHNFCNKRNVEMRINCISFTITSTTNFKTKFNYLRIAICPGKSSWKSKLQNFADTAGAEAMREQLVRCCFTTVLWTTVMNGHQQSNKQRSHLLKNLFENPNVSVPKWNTHYNSSVMSVTQLEVLITKKLSRIWARFLNFAWI